MTVFVNNEMTEDLQLLILGRHHNPHRFLGIHEDAGKKIIRLFRPGAEKIFLEVKGNIVEAEKLLDGLFVYHVSSDCTFKDYRIYHHNGLLAHDPYAFLPTFGELDAFLFNKGVHYELYKALGAHPTTNQGVPGVKFAVWAPNAIGVSLVADFNFFNGQVQPMRSMGESGVYELFIPGIKEGEKYKFEIRTKEGDLRIKSDPFAFWSELRPHTASVVFPVNGFHWEDEAWFQKRSSNGLNSPMSIYEVHLGSWKKLSNGEFSNYKDIAHELAPYCKRMGFTHIELMPIMEHPLDESWGYQVTGYFSTTSRYGTPKDFQYFVNYFHKEGIGVILDWVPAHFPTDDFALIRFDGTSLYEHSDPRQGYHPHWNTAIFNFGRHEVTNFLIASALFWLKEMHIDGLRVDAVASLLYLDYGREAGQWIPNIYGNNFNLESIEFLKHLNSIVHKECPGSIMIAEESTAFQGVTHSLEEGGLGFDLKWNMGWMNDTLRYFSKDPIYRPYHQNDLTFGLIYAFHEKFVCVLSHDEIVHGKRSLLSKMPGDEWQRFANLRLLYSYMICQPGKKLLFMGGEIAEYDEWQPRRYIEWHLLNFPYHQKIQKMVSDLNHFYQAHEELWQIDFSFKGFNWVDFADYNSCIISYLRKSENKQLAVVHNFTPVYREHYGIPLKNVKHVKEVFNTDHEIYGGSNKLNNEVQIGGDWGFYVNIAPLATMIFEVDFG